MKSKVWSLVFVLALVALPLLGACAPTAPPKEKVIKVGMNLLLTGPGAGAVAGIGVQHELAYFRNLNDTGGINGVRVDVLWDDTAMNVERTVAAYKKFKDAGVVAIIPKTTLEAEAVQSFTAADQIPLVLTSTTDKLLDPAFWSYNYPPTYTQMMAAMLKWVKSNWKESRPPRVAQIAPDMPLGRGHVEAIKKYAQSLGVEVGPFEYTSPIALDSTPQLLRIRDAKADFIYVNVHSASLTGLYLRDAKKLGILENFKWVLGAQGAHIWEGFELNTELVNGLMGVSYVTYPEENLEGVKYIDTVLRKYIAPDPKLGRPFWGSNYQNFTTTYIETAEAIKRALDKVGYEKVNGKTVKEALDSFKDYSPMGLTAPITYGPERRGGHNMVRMVRADWAKRTYVPVTDWFESPVTYGPKQELIFK